MKSLCIILSAFFTNIGYCSLDEYLADNKIKILEGFVIEAQKDFFRDFLLKHSSIHLIGETGFNAGHSAEVYLETRPDIQVVSFDIGIWHYVHAGKAYLQQTHPYRLELVLGDSRESVPAFHALHPSMQFDLIFIDGGHSLEVAFADIVNMRNLSHNGTFLIVDDLQIQSVKMAWDKAIRQGIIEMIQVYDFDDRSWGLASYRL